jgi:hypothetical protein
MTGHDILRDITVPLDFGNPVASLQRFFSLSLPPKAREEIGKQLMSRILSQPLTQIEINEIKKMVTDWECPTRTKDSILSMLRDVRQGSQNKLSEQNPPGRATCLFVVESGSQPFGCIQAITATTINDGKGDHRFLARETGGEVSIAFYTACHATRFVLKDYGLKPEGYRLLDNYGIVVQIGRLRHMYDGTSMSLAIAMAILSSLFTKPLSREFAFTGTLNIAGEVEKVGGIEEKIRIAVLKGIKRVYIPRANMRELKESREIEVIPVERLNQVVDSVFGKDSVYAFVQSLNRESQRFEKTELFLEPKGEDTVLLSTVGMRDPYGTSYHEEGDKQFTEGPVITAFRRIQPKTVVLFATRETFANAEKTQAEINNIVGQNICHIRKIEVKDPTDYDDLYIAILAAINSIRDMIAEKEAYISISSGTPQMHAVLIELLRSKKLIARPIQVREPRFATSWEDRVRLVRSEYLNIGI